MCEDRSIRFASYGECSAGKVSSKRSVAAQASGPCLIHSVYLSRMRYAPWTSARVSAMDSS